jgi:hypothetical protein
LRKIPRKFSIRPSPIKKFLCSKFLAAGFFSLLAIQTQAEEKSSCYLWNPTPDERAPPRETDQTMYTITPYAVDAVIILLDENAMLHAGSTFDMENRLPPIYWFNFAALNHLQITAGSF